MRNAYSLKKWSGPNSTEGEKIFDDRSTFSLIGRGVFIYCSVMDFPLSHYFVTHLKSEVDLNEKFPS